jgi:hypothetical protein
MLADYSVSFPPYCKLVECLVEGCPGRTCNRGHLHRHFMGKHPLDNIVILEEAPLPRCEACDMCVTHYALQNDHRNSEQCGRGAEAKKKRAIKENSMRASEIVFTIKGIPVENVRDFIELDRILSLLDKDWPDVHNDLVKARRKLDLISRVLRHEGSDPCITAMFYKAVVMAVLLFGSETWVVTTSMLQPLESFYPQIARRITGQALVYLRWEG